MIGIKFSLSQMKTPPLASEVQWWPDNAILAANFKSNRFRVGNTSISEENFLDTTRTDIGFAANTNGKFTPFEANFPRRTDMGLLIEPDATNIAPHSEPYSDASIYGGSVAGCNRVNIDWLNIFTKAVQMSNTTGSSVYAYANIPYQIGIYRTTLYLRATDSSALNIGIGNQVGVDCAIDVGTQVVSDLAQELVDASIGLYKVTFTTTVTVSGSYITGAIQHFNVGKTIQFSGLQIELGANATSPILTTGASANRVHDIIRADDISTSLSSMMQAIIVLALEIPHTHAANTLINISNGTNAQRVELQMLANGNCGLYVNSSTIFVFSVPIGYNVFAIGLKENGDISISMNGQTAKIGTSTLVDFSILSQASIGSTSAGLVGAQTMYHQITILDELPTPSRLEVLSTP